MHLRVSSVSSNGKTYQYAQLVESYRRQSDGMPAHRVVAKLGRITDPVQLENLKAAFSANRKGQRLGPVEASATEPTADAAPIRKPDAILRYLDVALVIAMMRELGLTEELARLLPKEDSDVAPEHVISALVAQRCLAPQSKLHAVRWFPRTALPELLGVSPSQFNNTRIHRVLEQLESVETELMRALSLRAHEDHGRFATMYMDLTDTWFAGDGPELAKKGKTKEGMVHKKIGIVLLCGESGHPLRWQVVQGATSEGPAMLQMMRTVQQVPWLEKIPIVCDRAMGRSAYIQQMLEAGIQFLTSLLTPEFDSYGVKLPSEGLADLFTPRSRHDLERCTTEATARAKATPELQRLSDNLFTVDLGVVECPVDETAPRHSRTLCSEALRIGLELTESVACGKYATQAAAARDAGLSPEQAHRYRNLARLDPDQQEQVLEAALDAFTVNQLVRIASVKDPEKRREAFCELSRAEPDPRHTENATRVVVSRCDVEPTPRKRVCCVAYFNPEICVRQRWLAHTLLTEIEAFVQSLNDRLANSRSPLKTQGALRLLEDRLRRHNLLNAFDVESETIDFESRSFPRLSLTLIPHQWQKRRAFDGFTVLVAHPDVGGSAAQLSQTYRAKNAVEVDFHVIKSLAKLRPVRHRTDLKVKAHVSLCMLALYIQRELTLRLQKDGVSPERCFEMLESYPIAWHARRGDKPDAYLLPKLGSEEMTLLRTLGMTRLAKERDMAASLCPRSDFVPTTNR